MDHIKHAFFPTKKKRMIVKESSSDQTLEARSLEQTSLPEGSTVKGGRNGDDGVDSRQSGQEEDD